MTDELIFQFRPEVNEIHQFWWRVVMIVLMVLMTAAAFGKYAVARYEGKEMSVSVVIGIIGVGVLVFGGGMVGNDLLHKNRKAFELRITAGGVLYLQTRKGIEPFELKNVDFVQIREKIHSAHSPDTSSDVSYYVRYLVISSGGMERGLRIPGGYLPPGDGKRMPLDKVRDFLAAAGQFTQASHITDAQEM